MLKKETYMNARFLVFYQLVVYITVFSYIQKLLNKVFSRISLVCMLHITSEITVYVYPALP